VIRPTDEVVKAMALIVRQYPQVLTFLTEWKAHELEQLPYAGNTSAVSQGRCQVLAELVKLATNSPDLAAKQTRSPSNTTHTG
jgi:hypothetical protein